MAKDKRFIEGLYEMAGVKQGEELSKFDEQKLKRALDSNKKLMGRNKDMFRDNEPRFDTCPSYNPCAICDKCQNKASHLYVKCQRCLIPICVHTSKDRAKMIRRHNFKVKVSEETMDYLKELASSVIDG